MSEFGKTPVTFENGTNRYSAPENQMMFMHIVYGLFAFGLFSAWATSIIGVIICYIKREDVAGTWLESHVSWHLRTFWWGLFWGLLGWLTFWFGLGFVIWIAAWIWALYRIIKGWLRLSEGRTI